MGSPELSILIPALHERMDNMLLDGVMKQAEGKPVEVIYLVDNRSMSVGRKRSILLSIAQGRYFTFIDDDDSVASDYVDSLLNAISPADGSDVICFRQECQHVKTGKVEHCEYSLKNAYHTKQVGPNEYNWYGLPAHTMCWRTELVQDIDFPDGNFGEDVGWVRLACERAKTEYQIDKVLYTYLYDEDKSRTRGL